MKKDLISIVVPIFNMEKYLEKCVNSIINQTYSNLEIILVNDGSTDRSGAICDNYKKIDKRVKVIHKDNGGLSDARNAGIKIAKGKYIGFVDSDDWLELDMYENMYNEMCLSDADVVICGRIIEYANGNCVKWYNKKRLEMDNIDALISLNSFCSFDMAAWDKLYKTNLFKDILYPYGKKCEDCYTTYKIFDKCKKIVYLPKCYYHYYQREGSISNGKTVNMDFIFASLEQMDYIEKTHPEILVVAKSNYAFSNNALYHFMLENNIRDNDKMSKMLKEARKYKKDVYKNKYITNRKKFNYFIFVNMPIIYNFIIKLKYKIKKR